MGHKMMRINTRLGIIGGRTTQQHNSTMPVEQDAQEMVVRIKHTQTRVLLAAAPTCLSVAQAGDMQLSEFAVHRCSMGDGAGMP
jgi:hypothetical protein